MDILTKKTLRRAIRKGCCIDSAFLYKLFHLSLQTLEESFSRCTALFFFNSKYVILSPNFDLIYWDELERVMASWPQTVRASYSKILAKFIGVNHFLNQISHGKINAKCLCYSHPDKTTEHIILCQNSARTTLYHDAVDKVGQWMNSQQIDSLITTMVLKYLRAQTELTMCQCYEGSRLPTLLGWVLAIAHDCLGWRNFSKGRIASKYKSIQCRWCHKIESRQSSKKWAANFIAQLIKITNLQWTYRNNFLHYRQHSGAKLVRNMTTRCHVSLILLSRSIPTNSFQRNGTSCNFIAPRHSPR